MAVDKKISELAFGKNIRNNFLPIVENGVNKRLYLQTLSKRFDILNKTQNYNLKQTDYRNLIVCNCNQSPYGDLNLYLPAGADAIIGFPYVVQHGIYQGFVKVNVKGGSGNKILYKGQELDYFLLYSKGQKVEFLWDGNYWMPKKETDIIMDIGFLDFSDQAARHLGNGVTYDNKSVAGSWTGQVFTEEISGFSAVCIYDDTVNSILYFYELSSGFTYFTNNRQLTASNGITCDVNEASGTSENIDYDLYHGFGISVLNYYVRSFYNTSANFNSALDITYQNGGDDVDTGSKGNMVGLIQVDNNSCIIQTDIDGFGIISTLGAQSTVTAVAANLNQRIIF